jgi:APA family basic amino acid/polyamine antiporter
VPLLIDRKALTARGVVLPALAFLYSIWALWGSGAETVMYGLILLLLGLPVYVFLRRERRAETTV